LNPKLQKQKNKHGTGGNPQNAEYPPKPVPFPYCMIETSFESGLCVLNRPQLPLKIVTAEHPSQFFEVFPLFFRQGEIQIPGHRFLPDFPERLPLRIPEFIAALLKRGGEQLSRASASRPISAGRGVRR
jgi:hypothetical protein